MRILFEYENKDIEDFSFVRSFLCELSKEEEEKVVALQFYIDSINFPSNFVYSNMGQKIEDEALFREYKTVNELITTIFENKNTIGLQRQEDSFPGAYCCRIYSEKLMASNICVVHVTEFYNI